jgi:hypothetical protein
MTKARGAHLELGISPQLRRRLVQLRGRMTVSVGREIRLGKNQVHGNSNQRFVAREQRDAVDFALEGTGQVGRKKTRARNVFADVAGNARVAAPGDESLPEDDVGGQPLHDREMEVRVVVIDGGNEPADVGGDSAKIRVLEMSAFRRHGPSRTRDPNIGQRLLETDGPRRSVHQEHQVQVAVTHLPDAPVLGTPAQQRGYAVELRDERRNALGIQNLVTGVHPAALSTRICHG